MNGLPAPNVTAPKPTGFVPITPGSPNQLPPSSEVNR